MWKRRSWERSPIDRFDTAPPLLRTIVARRDPDGGRGSDGDAAARRMRAHMLNAASTLGRKVAKQADA